MTPEYTIIGYKEINTEQTNNLIEAVKIIERMKSEGLKVVVASGDLTAGVHFVERVRRLYT